MSLAIFMFALAGIPPTGGFVGKFYIFGALISSKHYTLAIIGILNSALALYYYLNVVVHMYMKGEDSPVQFESYKLSTNLAVIISVVGIFLIGIFPSALYDMANEAFLSILK